MALTAAQQIEQDIAEFLAHHEKPSAEWSPVISGRTLIAGHKVLPHVQAFADDVRKATRVQSIGTYPGHSPSIDRALDLFHAVSDNALADAISDFAIKNQARYGVRYVIDRQEIWHRLDPVWRRMEDRGDNTQNHYDHNHISFETEAAKAPPTPEPDPQQQEKEDMAIGLFVYDYNGSTWLTDGMITRQTNDPFIYLNAGAKHLGKFHAGQHNELLDRGDLVTKDKGKK